MSERFFGTDGLRGQVGEYPLVPEIALRLALAAGEYFARHKKNPKVIIGKDTRLSCDIFECALSAGLCASGVNVYLAGVLPTPAISFLVQKEQADLGVVISASHNKYTDNGIKFFDSTGFKLSDEVENILTNSVLDTSKVWQYATPGKEGTIRYMNSAQNEYREYLEASCDVSLTGLTIVLDCAHGAAFAVGQELLEKLGAKVILMNAEPTGLNINEEGGSLYPEYMAKEVLKYKADIGIALDGDADRLILCDEYGLVLDGDQIMAICAKDLLSQNKLVGANLVATVMSNMALDVFMAENGGKLIRTAVGDRYVIEKMRELGATFGGEQSGHILFMDNSKTGDGLLAALKVLSIVVRTGKKVSELASMLKIFPQRLINVSIKERVPFRNFPEIEKAVKDAEKKLGERGRVLLRFSGTELKARVMVEGEDLELVDKLAENIAEIVKKSM